MKQYYCDQDSGTNKCDGMGEKCDELELYVVRDTFYVADDWE